MTVRSRSFIRKKHSGAALLTAMLTLVLVATLSAGVAWQQWRSVELERAERARLAASWLLVGALDWGRLILREDARSGGADHLAEPWAVPLQESRLSSFLAADQNNNALLSDTEDANVFLSGQMVDLQSRLNAYNLIESGRINEVAFNAFDKLFDLLNLEPAELQTLANNLRRASDLALDNGSGGDAFLLPQRYDQLTRLGLSSESLERLRPFVTWLPARTPVNLNTASPEVLYASIPLLELDGARRIVAERSRKHLRTVAEAGQLIPGQAKQLEAGQHSIATRFFEITGRIRLVDGEQSVVVVERSAVQRDGMNVSTLWRERGSFPIESGGVSGEELARSLR